MKNIIDNSLPFPTQIGDRVNITPENSRDLLLSLGWRIGDDNVPPLDADKKRVSSTWVEGDGINGQWFVVDRLISEIDAEVAQADLIAHQELYLWENRTIQFLRRIGVMAADAVIAPDNVEKIIEERLYALSQDQSQAQTYVALVTRAATLRDQIVRKGGALQAIKWHPEIDSDTGVIK
jgi:hypothetical protein